MTSFKADEKSIWQLLAVMNNYWVSTGQLKGVGLFTSNFDVSVEFDDPRHPRFDARYGESFSGLSEKELPMTECLKDTVARFVPFWEDTIAPAVKSGKSVIVAAHGNSIRALVKYLDNISDDAIVGVNIPNGIPLVYELDADLKLIRRYYLGDAQAAAAAAAAVAAQGQR